MADSHKRKEPEKVCTICGSVGYVDNLVTCSRCKKVSEHIYCMKVYMLQNPKVWYCVECSSAAADSCERVQDVCKRKRPLSHPTSNTPFKAIKSSKVKYIPLEEINSNTRAKGQGECRLFNPLSRQNGRPNVLPPPHLRTVTTKAPALSQSMKAVKVSGSIAKENSIIDKKQDAQMNKISVPTPYGEQPTFVVQGISLPATSRTVPTKNLASHCASEVCWKGTFEVSFGNGCYEIYGGFEAFLAKHASAKVSEFSRYLPRNLELNSLASKDAQPRAFQLDPPNHEDIGFYFFPNKTERSKEEYIHLVEKIDVCDFAMRFLIGKVELIIYSSSQLNNDCQRTYENNYYLWGFFRHIRKRKHYQHNLESSLCSPADLKKNGYCQTVEIKAEEVDMEIDMIGCKEVGQLNIPLSRVDAPPGFTRAIYSRPSQKNIPSNASFKTNIQTNGHIPPGNSRILELSRIRSQGARTRSQDCSIQDNKFVSDNTDVLPKLCQVTSGRNANLEPSTSTHATLVKSNVLHSPEKHTNGRVQLTDRKLHHAPRSPSFSSSISYDQGLHQSVVGLAKFDGVPCTDDEASKKMSIVLSKDTAQSFVHHPHIREVNEEVDREDILSATIDAPPGFPSRIYSHSSHAKTPPMNCLRTRSLVTKDAPSAFPETPDSKDIVRLQGATFEEFNPKDILSHTLDVPPGFNSRDYSRSEGSPIKWFLKKTSVVKRDAPNGFLKAPNLNDIVRQQCVKFEAQECHTTQSMQTIDACGKRPVDKGRNTFVEHFRKIKKEDFGSP